MLKKMLCRIPLIGKKYKKSLIRKEGGEKTSSFLRKMTKEKYNVDIGMYSYGSCFLAEFNTGGTVKIGRYCSIARDVHYYGSNHPMNHAVMSAYFYNSDFGGLNVRDVERKTLEIGHDVWIGHGAVILSGCEKIGNGSVIAAGAVVTKDVPPYAIVGGIPAKVLKYRFDQEIIDLLEESKWWTHTPQELYSFYDKIDQPALWAKAIMEVDW